MGIPGNRAVKQWAGGTEADCDATLVAEREIIVDMENFILRLGDGATTGGVAKFISEERIITLIAGGGGDPISPGSDDLAAAGLDSIQRSWPATSFGQFALLDSPIFEGNPRATTAPTGSNSTRIATTEFVANNFAPMPYLGSTRDETIFPIGHPVLAELSTHSAPRNQLPDFPVGLHPDFNGRYKLGGTGANLSGNWRARGIHAADESDDNNRSIVLLVRVG